MSANASINIDVEDAFNFIIRFLREGIRSEYGSFGYDVYLPNIMRKYLQIIVGIHENQVEGYLRKVSPSFYAAAWELCRRGIFRPGINAYMEQCTADGSGGNGYSITPTGSDWIRSAGQYDYVPVEPGRMSRILNSYGDKFGAGFMERCQEAIRCYGAQAYLACCVMCGAAAEAIILSIAITKAGDETKVIKDYSSSGGRGRIENLILGQQGNNIKSEFQGYSTLLKYWRDAAAHGKLSNISDNEAYTSLALLLRFALYANENWDVLVGNSN